jgi:hypothetical protein
VIGQLPVVHQRLAIIIGLGIGVLAEEFCHLSLHRTRQQRTLAIVQNFGKRIGEGFWQAKC